MVDKPVCDIGMGHINRDVVHIVRAVFDRHDLIGRILGAGTSIVR